MKEELKRLSKYLMIGTYYIIPLIIIGGVLEGLSITIGEIQGINRANTYNVFLNVIMDIKTAAFSMIVPVFAGFIAYGIAGMQGIIPGFVVGVFANNIKLGLVGGIIAGIIAGYTVLWIKSWSISKSLKSIMNIFIIPILSSLIVGIIMIYVLKISTIGLMEYTTGRLKVLYEGNSISLALVIGAAIALDIGGPLNKAVLAFAFEVIGKGVYTVMGPAAVAICIPPLGMGLASLLAPEKYTQVEKNAGYCAIIMGFMGITEGAIPFATADPLRVIPSIIAGSSIGAAMAYLGGVEVHTRQGGPIAILAVDNKIIFIMAVLVGMAVTAFLANTLKKEVNVDINIKY